MECKLRGKVTEIVGSTPIHVTISTIPGIWPANRTTTSCAVEAAIDQRAQYPLSFTGLTAMCLLCSRVVDVEIDHPS